jgi:hypothetical protein
MGRYSSLPLLVAPIRQKSACLVPLRTFTSTAEYPLVTFLTDLAILLMFAVCVDAWVLRRAGEEGDGDRS